MEELKRRMPSSMFVRWHCFIKEQVNDFHREDYFWANIAFILARANSKNPEKIEFEPFLIKFEEKKVEEPTPVYTDEEYERAAEKASQLSKTFWARTTTGAFTLGD